MCPATFKLTTPKFMFFVLFSKQKQAHLHTSALICGGLSTLEYNSSAQAACYMFTNNMWTTVASLTTARYGHGMAVYKGTVEIAY